MKVKLTVEVPTMNNSSERARAVKLVSGILGIGSISVDEKEKKLTIVGENFDPVEVLTVLRKGKRTTIRFLKCLCPLLTIKGMGFVRVNHFEEVKEKPKIVNPPVTVVEKPVAPPPP